MLICIFNYRNDDNARRWLSLLSPHFDTVVLDSGNTNVVKEFIQYPNIFYSGLFNKMKHLSEEKGYEWVGLICSDVTIDDVNAEMLIRQLKWVETTENVGQYQPSFDSTSYKWRGNNNTDKYVYEGKHLLDGPIVFMKNSLLQEYPYIDTNLNLYGCGIGRCFSVLSERRGYLNLFDNSVVVHHPEGTGYNKEESMKHTDNYISYFMNFYGMTKEELNRSRLNNSIGDISSLITYKNNNTKTSKSKNVIYTCITGEYDYLSDPSLISNDFDYVCFSDSIKYDGNVWKIRPIPEELRHLSNVKQQRVIKICPHRYLSEYDLSVWIDGNIDIRIDIESYISMYCTDDTKSVYIPYHPKRNCIYTEGDVCARLGKDTKESVDSVLQRYREEGFPDGYGLVQTGVIIRRHNDQYCIKLMDMWAYELVNNSHRDQLSFNYCLWIMGDYGFAYLPAQSYSKRCFSICKHNAKRQKVNIEISKEECNNFIETIKIFILDCGYPWYINKYESLFSKLGDVEIVNCNNGYFSKGYEKINESLRRKEYGFILIIRSNVNIFANPSIGEKIVDNIKRIIKNNSDIGVYSPSVDQTGGINNPSIRKNRNGVRQVSVVGENILLINTEYVKNIPSYTFASCRSGSGFIDKVCENVSSNCGKIIVDDGAYVTTSYAKMFSTDMLEQHKRSFNRYNADKK